MEPELFRSLVYYFSIKFDNNCEDPGQFLKGNVILQLKGPGKAISFTEGEIEMEVEI